MKQLNIFNALHERFKIDNTNGVRLFEAFAGYGSQYMALKRLGVKVDVVGISEIDKYAILVYASIHTNFLDVVSKMYIKSKSITFKYTIQDLLNMPDFTKFLFESKILKVANELSKNYGAIGSFDRLPKDIDICTWSFPCQDISLAGKQRGMVDGSRSNYGFVFLDTVANTPYDERPKVLIMENVRALFSSKFKDDWQKIQHRLETMGYTNYSSILNSKHYGVAQNRERVFIVSILGGGLYEFPKPYKLTKRLKDYLEDEVDEKYFISDKMMAYFTDMTDRNGFIRGKRFKPHTLDSEYAYAITTNAGNRPTDNFIVDEKGTRKLTPREVLRLMDVSEDDINIILSLVSNTQAYKLAGNSIVVNVLVEMFKEMIP
jgi:DNA (cytosine-5)-methyltransferase 1